MVNKVPKNVMTKPTTSVAQDRRFVSLVNEGQDEEGSAVAFFNHSRSEFVSDAPNKAMKAGKSQSKTPLSPARTKFFG